MGTETNGLQGNIEVGENPYTGVLVETLQGDAEEGDCYVRYVEKAVAA